MAIEVGSVVEGKVTKITNFGAFVELDEEKSGLIHISEVANEYVNDIGDFLHEGDVVKAKVVSIDPNGKVALSIKRLKPPSQEDKPRATKPKQNKRLSASFEDKLSKFLKDSDERLTDLKRKTDSKRGGRGSRRSD